MGQRMKRRLDIEKLLSEFMRSAQDSQPIIFDLSKQNERDRFIKMFDAGKVTHVVDQYLSQLRELFEVTYPTLSTGPKREQAFSDFLKKIVGKQPLWRHGRWVWYPWLATFVHVLEDVAYQTVRTARNRYLITNSEQKKYYNSTVGVAGMSIGNNVALAVVLEGGARNIRIADFDNLALSNVNRIRAGVHQLGLRKVIITARQIYLLNPFQSVVVYPDGLSSLNIDEFFVGPPKLDVVVDEIDNLSVKYLIRKKSQKYKTPVIMGADSGHDAVIDVERFDINPAVDFFLGKMKGVSFDKLINLDKNAIGQIIQNYIGKDSQSKRMSLSLSEIGKSILTWPQLGTTAIVNGSLVAHHIRRIILKQESTSSRRVFSLNK